MITDVKDLVICLSPVLWILFLISILFTALEDWFDAKGILRFLSYLLLVAFIVTSFMKGAKYQELILFLLGWLLSQAILMVLHPKKENNPS